VITKNSVFPARILFMVEECTTAQPATGLFTAISIWWLLVVVILLPKIVGVSGVVIAALAFTLSQFFEIAYLLYRSRRLELG
jgi:hypothetical protein